MAAGVALAGWRAGGRLVGRRARDLSRQLARLLVALCVLACVAMPVRADSPVEVDALRLARGDDALLLSTAVRFDLPAVVDEALRKGIPMHFVYEADLVEPRWYWTDKVITTAVRTVRLSWQPLTRRWRLNVYAGPPGAGNLAQTFGQNFDTIEEAMGAVRRVSGWRIAAWSEVEPGSRQRVDLRFRLDLTQLPRPMQIGIAGQSEWRIVASRSQRLGADIAP